MFETTQHLEIKMFTKYPAGAIGAILSLAGILVGLPLQIYAIWLAGSSEALSIPLLLANTSSSAHYAIHGYQTKDRSILYPQLLCVPLMSIVIVECIYFR